ncbi:MAG: hypothetical protein ABIN91_05280 [Mucilaginibacter sp.]|uniref:hypothetical protein n=1 Tax=Mucilaginibacter sp. TaxID=1882438 RepID=UPI00326745F1
MIANSNKPGGKEGANNTSGENSSDSALDKDVQKNDTTKLQKDKTDDSDPRIETVVPDNDN